MKNKGYLALAIAAALSSQSTVAEEANAADQSCEIGILSEESSHTFDYTIMLGIFFHLQFILTVHIQTETNAAADSPFSPIRLPTNSELTPDPYQCF